MQKVLIVDDEAAIRGRLRGIVDWEANGFTIVGEAANGLEGCRRADTLRPDLLISDIRMPEMDGIALSAHVQRSVPGCRVVVLSVYSEFGYIRSAMKNGVVDYLLKPVSREDVLEMLARVRNLRDKDARQYQESIRQNPGQALTDAMFRYRLVDDAEFTAHTGIDPSRHSLSVMLLRLDDDGGAGDDEQDCLRDIVLETARDEARGLALFHITDMAPGVYACVLSAHNPDDVPAAARRVRQAVETVAGCAAMASLSSPVHTLAGLHACYREAQSFLETGFFFGGSALISVADMAEGQRQIWELAAVTDRSGLYTAIEDNDEPGVLRALEELFEALAGRRVQPSEADALFLNIALTAGRIIGRYNADYMDVLRASYGSGGPAAGRRLSELSREITEFCLRMTRYLADLRRYRPVQLSGKVKKIVEERYAEPLTLKGIASELYISAMYLGQLFSKECGCTFNQYLNELRISKAVRLLLTTDLPVNEIALCTGYATPAGFYQMFKRFKNCSPMEYRRKYQTKGPAVHE